MPYQSKLLRSKEWIEYREKVLDLDGYTCVQCHRTSDEGITLQVHHKTYESGRLPWEYDFSDCEVLCKGCHAAEHGIIKPRFGWYFIAEEDLGSLDGECELCGTELRYLHTVYHPSWGSLDVGTICCDTLTGTTQASEARKKRTRLNRFIKHEKWVFDRGQHYFTRAGINIVITGDHFDITGEPRDFTVELNDISGRMHFDTLENAKKHVFELIISGKARNYLEQASG